jgi:hypothetical protein
MAEQILRSTGRSLNRVSKGGKVHDSEQKAIAEQKARGVTDVVKVVNVLQIVLSVTKRMTRKGLPGCPLTCGCGGAWDYIKRVIRMAD